MRSKAKIQLVSYLDQIFPELAQFFKGNLHLNDAISLRELAKNSVGIDNPSLSLQIKHAILQIELYNEQIAEVEALYKQILDEMNTPIIIFKYYFV